MNVSLLIDYAVIFGAFVVGYYLGSADGLLEGYSVALESMGNGVHNGGL